MKFFLLILLGLLILGCESESEKPAPPAPPEKITITLWNWPNYMTQEAMQGFEQETGIHVEQHIFEDEEILLGAIQGSDFQADLFVISDSSSGELIQAQIAAPLDPALLTNVHNIEPNSLNLPFDPQQRFTVPYLAGTTGVAINTKHVPANADSWNVLWDKALSGHIAMLDNNSEVVAVGAKKLGFHIVPDSEKQFAAVKKELLRQRPLLKGYLSVDEITEGLVSGELWAAHIYSGDALGAAQRNPDITYFVPKEGAVRWLDVFMIPRTSRHIREAQMFINYLHRPEVMAKVAAAMRNATPNVEAHKLLPQETLSNPSIYPPENILARCEHFPIKDSNSTSARRTSELWNALSAP